MILNESKGNLFELDNKYALAHCTSEDCEMGKGIAVEFDKKFRGMKNYCKRVVEYDNLSFPCVIHYSNNYQSVFNLVTKKSYYGKPTYTTITKCISEMAYMCRQFNIRYLGIPKLGCGLDRLQWGRVRDIIQEEFKDIDIEIEVRYL
ncbi:macro domain-containing protein [Clostridium tertium]|uniref:macro domain-containing protein n=1 Tax=Clostridium tertium TaxID=1559 RepID=UPI0023B28F97|nr:macro domain-containing protein [Clostridium tertium]